MQTQGLTAKKSKLKESKPKKAKLANSTFSALLRFDKAVKLNYQEKKKSIEIKNKIEKILLWSLETMPLKVVVRRKKATKSAIIV